VSASVVGASGAAGSGLAGGSGAIASGTVTSSGADGAVPRDGGALAGPKCAPTPTKLIDASEFMANANGVSAAMDLAVSTTDLYVAVNYNQGGAVLSVPIRGGRPVVVATGGAQALLVTGDSLILAEGDIVKIALPGGAGTVLASGPVVATDSYFGPSGILATDGQNVYFATPDGTQSVPLAGGMVQTLTTHTGALTVAGANIVIADSSAGGIFSVPIEGGPATLLATSPAGDLGPVLSCGADICWASAVEVSPSQVGTATLVQLGPMGVPATLSEDPALYVVYRLVFDGSEFFATMLRDLSFGSLATIPAAGGPPFSMGPGSGLAIDDECLYVADAIGGVYSVAKSYRGTVVVPP
jgi:hypothetical protein